MRLQHRDQSQGRQGNPSRIWLGLPIKRPGNVDRTDGLESVQIDIFKEADSNMVQVAEGSSKHLAAQKVGKIPALPDAFGKTNKSCLKWWLIVLSSFRQHSGSQEHAIVGGAWRFWCCFYSLRSSNDAHHCPEYSYFCCSDLRASQRV